MSRRWKAENADKLGWEIADTPLRAALPEVEAILGKPPFANTQLHRVRLMKLLPGGALSRHADITDPDAGARPGKLLRLHVPIETNANVVFSSWLPDGAQARAVMGPGALYYLDTRKPHAARNDGEGERIHLVVDAEASPELLDAIACGALAPIEAPFVPPAPAERGATLRPLELAAAAPADSAAGPGSATWIVGDARDLTEICAGTAPRYAFTASDEGAKIDTAAPRFDLIFTCPPYFDLEIYSDDPADLSRAASFDAFRQDLARIVADASAQLRENRFAVFVVGEVRARDGRYVGLVPALIAAAEAAGLHYYNEAILVTVHGSLPVRVARFFEVGRKVGKTHQNVLIFCKGDPAAATRACGPVEISFGEPEAAGS